MSTSVGQLDLKNVALHGLAEDIPGRAGDHGGNYPARKNDSDYLGCSRGRHEAAASQGTYPSMTPRNPSKTGSAGCQVELRHTHCRKDDRSE